MELNDIIAAVGIGALLGFGMVVLYVWYLWNKIKSRVDQIINEVIQEAESNLVGLDIEVDNGTYFCYNNEDKQFVCQGANVAEIRQAFQARFPTKTAYLAGGDPAAVEQLQTQIAQQEPKQI